MWLFETAMDGCYACDANLAIGVSMVLLVYCSSRLIANRLLFFCNYVQHGHTAAGHGPYLAEHLIHMKIQ
jgi:hypothetical protein